MKTNYINKKNPVQKAKIYEESTHLYKFYSFKFIEFKPKFFKFEGPQSLRLYRDDTTTTTTVYINRQKIINMKS